MPVTTEEFFAAAVDYEALHRGEPELVDVKFNQPDAFQAPRSLRLSDALPVLALRDAGPPGDRHHEEGGPAKAPPSLLRVIPRIWSRMLPE